MIGVDDAIQLTVARKYKLPEGWSWCRSEVVGDAEHSTTFLITGGVPRTLTRGPRKGRRSWDKSVLTGYVITRADMDETKADQLTKQLLASPDGAGVAKDSDQQG